MRYARRAAGAACLAVAAMLAIAGIAGASTLTQAPPFTGTVKAESEGAISMQGTIDIECQKSTVEWSVEEHGTSVATGGPLGTFTLEECGQDTVTVFNRGRFELHATSGGNGTMTWSNAEFTVQRHTSIFGFPLTTHCIYKPEETDLGTFTGSATTKETARLDIWNPSASESGLQIPLKATDSGCGEIALLKGSYTFTSPDYLVVE